ncbi:MAG TPA: hypothetical protein PKH24_11865 [Sedimentisphaerales bacterium]|jgi:hypothetical protein|nr:hypothetical protein [Sedimentisphaerales bacterium]
MYDSLRVRSVQTPIIPVVGEWTRANPGDTFGVRDRCLLRVACGALRKDTAAEGIGRLVRGLREILAT